MIRAIALSLLLLSIVSCTRSSPGDEQKALGVDPLRHDVPPAPPAPPRPAPPPVPEQALQATAGQRALALSLLTALREKEPGENLFLSPFSISAALSMTAAGARGETRADFDRVVKLLPGDAAHEAYAALHQQIVAAPSTGAELRVANRIYVDKRWPLAAGIADLTRDRYSASIEPVDFQTAFEPARLAINAWVEEQTRERIKDLLPEKSLDDETRLVLVNAIYFLGRWRERFDEARTTDGPFHARSGDVPARLMHGRIKRAEIVEEANAQWLRLRYQNEDLALLVALPRAHDGLPALLASLDVAAWDRVRGSLRPAEVDVTLPRFTIEDPSKLAGVLARLGMGHTFCPMTLQAPIDLSGLGGAPGDLCVSEVVHKAFVQVDEAGTEAAAATAVIVTRAVSVRPSPPVFVADHPFLFAIEHVPSGAPLFLGLLERP